jgi:hypothetical protein
MVLVCSVILMLHRRGSTWLLDMSHIIIQSSLQRVGIPLSKHYIDILKHFPRDVPTIISKFNLDTKSLTYAACPKCHHIYAPTVNAQTGLLEWQVQCNYRRYNRGKRCKEILTRSANRGNGGRVPIKPFVSYDFSDWLGRLVSRPENEKNMDRAWDGILEPAPSVMSDIFHGELLRNFQGPGDNPRHFSLSSDQNEGRYVFSVGFDFFNPLTNKQAGKKLSVGAVTLVCLNLPISERYKPENMFLAGLIPGPNEPPLDTINSYWTPLVDTFLTLWEDGIKFSRTHDYECGRVVRCAIVAVICDLPAARKIGGFSSHSHRRFCTHCVCSRNLKSQGQPRQSGKKTVDGEDTFDQEVVEAERRAEQEELNVATGDGNNSPNLHSPRTDHAAESFANTVLYGEGVGFNDFNTDRWQRRTAIECRTWMEKYKAAATEAEAQRYFNQSGLRWTEFLRLPYFDVSRMIVVDCMHNLFLGLLREHFRGILGFRASTANPPPPPAIDIFIPQDQNNPLPTQGKNDEKSVTRALKILRNRMVEDSVETMQKGLAKCTKPALLYVVKGVSCAGLKPQMTKAKLATLLVDWVRFPLNFPQSPF